MSATQRAVSAALLCAALSLGATGCGSSAAKPAGTADPAVRTGAPVSAGTDPSGSSAQAGAAPAVSADALAAKAAANLRAATSLHVVGSAAVLKVVGGKYLASTTSAKGVGSSLADLCDVNKGLFDTAEKMTMIVSDTTVPEIPQIVNTGTDAGTLDFSGYNAPVTLTAPPKSRTLDAAKYGM
jgi:hypothetical protein